MKYGNWTPNKPKTKAEAMALREAFFHGANCADGDKCYPYNDLAKEADRCFPIPTITRPRVHQARSGGEYRIRDGVLEYRTHSSASWVPSSHQAVFEVCQDLIPQFHRNCSC